MPEVKPNETESEFLKRCIPVLVKEGKTPEQAVAQCTSMFEQTQKSVESDYDFEISGSFIEIEKGEELRLVTGIVLEPEVTDLQGDIYSAEEIRKTAHQFMAEEFHGQGNGLLHRNASLHGLRLVESYIAPVDMEINKNKVKKGTWLMSTKVLDDAVWKSIKSGDITGYSIGGASRARPEN